MLAAACGGSSPGPGPGPVSPLALRPGLQILTVSGAAVSTDPQLPPCAPIAVPRDGTAVGTYVMLAADGDEWIARSRSGAEGTIELRLRADRQTVRGWTVTGTLTGMGVDVGLNDVDRDVRVTLAGEAGTGPARLEGETLSPMSAFVGGRASGSIRFSDSADNGSTCTAVQWTMQPR